MSQVELTTRPPPFDSGVVRGQRSSALDPGTIDDVRGRRDVWQLGKRDTGPDGPIRQMQQRLIDLGYLGPGGADGIFGPTTQGAVRSFQRQHGLEPDGKVGERTIARLHPPEGAAAPQRSTDLPEMSHRQAAEVLRNQMAAQRATEEREATAAQEFLRSRPTEGVGNMTPRDRRDTLQRLPEIRGRLTPAQLSGPIGQQLASLEAALRQRDLHPSGLPRPRPQS